MASTPIIASRFVRCRCFGALLAIAAVCGGTSRTEQTAGPVTMDSVVMDIGGLADGLDLDPMAFGSTAGMTGLRSAPTTWSSRSSVRWNARWDSHGRFIS